MEGFIGLLVIAGAVASALHDEHADLRKEMQRWSEQRLHAYAGVKSHPKEMKTFAYDLAKKKKYERLSK